MSTALETEVIIDVRIAKLPVAALPGCFGALLEMAFFLTVRPTFLTISVTEGSVVTLVTEASFLDTLAAATPALDVDPIVWACVRVGEGTQGFEEVGLVERFTEPLAEAGIPVLYQSTYSTDYCLLPRERLAEAFDCLGRSASDRPDEKLGESTGTAARHTYPLTIFDNAPAIVLRLDTRQRQWHTGALIRLLFMPQPSDAPQALVSFTETADEISIYAGASGWWQEYCTGKDNDGLQHNPQEWVPIRVGGTDGTPLSETGVVATQAKVLADANLSILYHSTFPFDFTLVLRADVERATEAFASAGFSLSIGTPPDGHVAADGGGE
jgi:hypothetical protein